MTVSERDTLLELVNQIAQETPLVYEGASPLKILKDYLQRLLKTDEER
jgi:hypothetical protein